MSATPPPLRWRDAAEDDDLTGRYVRVLHADGGVFVQGYAVRPRPTRVSRARRREHGLQGDFVELAMIRVDPHAEGITEDGAEMARSVRVALAGAPPGPAETAVTIGFRPHWTVQVLDAGLDVPA